MKGPMWQISLTTSVEAEEAVAVIFENFFRHLRFLRRHSLTAR